MEISLHDFAAGCIGGFAGVVVGHPFDTVKVRLQQQCSKNPRYRGPLDCFQKTIRKETPLGLYKGAASPLATLPAINAIVFGVEGNVNRSMKGQNPLLSHFISGAVAGFAQCVICSPMELVKTQMQIQGEGLSRQTAGVYRNSLHCLYQIWRCGGLRGVSRGFGLTALREVPACGIYFTVYEILCSLWTKEHHTRTPTWVLLMAGGFAGCSSWLSSYPIDVIKTRYQSDLQINDRQFITKYANYRDCYRQSIQEEGYSLLHRGLGVTMFRAFPVNAATFAAVVLSLRWFRRENETDEVGDIMEYLPVKE